MTDDLILLMPLLLLAVAMGTAALLARIPGVALREYKFREIEGLRGVLALFVFVHHAYVWREWMKTGRWEMPASHLFAHLGQSSVALFFMITAFLFTNRLLDRERPISWLGFGIARFMRLMPAYVAAVLVLLYFVAVASGFQVDSSPLRLAVQSMRWLALGVLGMPDVNGVANTGQMMAWVVWSLPYEVLFYVALPLGALLVGASPGRAVILVSLGCLAILATRGLEGKYLLAFVPGIVAAFLARDVRVRRLCSSPAASVLILVALAAGIWVAPTVFHPVAYAAFAAFFIAIACGNSLFGLLRTRGADALGQASYSVYLLHGLVLFGILRFGLGFSRAAAWSEASYWAFAAVLASAVVCVAYASFRYIEAPGMRSAAPIARWLRSKSKADAEAAAEVSARAA